MATYKLLQDIEAEDHVLGPLTLRQFIFALIAVFMAYLCFLVATKGAPFLLVIFLPPFFFFGFFALPLGRDQPTEIWALAKLRFLFKSRQRVWNQSGVKELVTITAPKKIERVMTDGLSQTEVKGRLKALASTLDSRGWAVKNVDVNAFAAPPIMSVNSKSSDRLIDVTSSMPQSVPDAPVTAADDILDPTNNPMAQKFDAMIDQSSQAHRQEIINEMNAVGNAAPAAQTPASGQASQGQPQPDYWFVQDSQAMPQPAVPAPVAASIDPNEEAALTANLKARHVDAPAAFGHMRTVAPLSTQSQQPPADNSAPASTPVTPHPDPAILSLANNDDLNVATLARQANRDNDKDGSKGEVVVPLH